MPQWHHGEITMTPLIDKTPAEHLAALLQGASPRSDDEPLSFRLNLRLPPTTAAMVAAFAEHARRSRNFMADQLLIVGAQATLDAMPEAERDQVQGLWLIKQSQFIDQAANEENE